MALRKTWNLRIGVTNSTPDNLCVKIELNSHQFLHCVVTIQLWHLIFSLNDWTMPKLKTDLLRYWCGRIAQELMERFQDEIRKENLDVLREQVTPYRRSYELYITFFSFCLV